MTTEVELLQKKIIEMQDGEIVRLRMELDRLKFELSKLQSLQINPSPSPLPINVPPFRWEYVPATAPSIPEWVITCGKTISYGGDTGSWSIGTSTLELNKNVSTEVPESTK